MKSQASQNRKSKAAQMVHSKVKPVVVKHVLAQNYIQKPEVYQLRPQKTMSLQSAGNYGQSQISGSVNQSPYQQPGLGSSTGYTAGFALQHQPGQLLGQTNGYGMANSQSNHTFYQSGRNGMGQAAQQYPPVGVPGQQMYSQPGNQGQYPLQARMGSGLGASGQPQVPPLGRL